MYRKQILLALLLVAWSFLQAQGPGFLMGVRLNGGEATENMVPGTLNQQYGYPSEEEVEYYYRKGFQLVSLPFRWERIQKGLGEELSENDLAALRRVMGWCNSRGMKVLLSMHNGGRYRRYGIDFILGSATVPRSDFADVWNKLANVFSGYNNLYGYEIMAEPHEMQSFDWQQSAQAAIAGIREADRRNLIIVSGDNYAAADTWNEYSDKLRNLTDPQDKLIFNAQCFFDNDFTGRYLYSFDQNKAEEQTGVKRVAPFVEWLKKNNKKGMIGAFGVPDSDDRWLKVMEVFVQYLKDNQMPAIYVQSGKQWNNSSVSLYPSAAGEKPQMNVLASFVQGRAAGYSAPAAVSSAPVGSVSVAPASAAPSPAPAAAGVTAALNDSGTAPSKPLTPPPPPESFLFLPGTILLPEPNGGLYKPTLPGPNKNQQKMVSGIRLAKYNTGNQQNQ